MENAKRAVILGGRGCVPLGALWARGDDGAFKWRCPAGRSSNSEEGQSDVTPVTDGALWPSHSPQPHSWGCYKVKRGCKRHQLIYAINAIVSTTIK